MALRPKRAVPWTWHPGVRAVLLILVLVPLGSTAWLTATRGVASWKDKARAQTVASEVRGLADAARCRDVLNQASVPLDAVSYAAGLGINESTLESLLRPAVPFAVQLSTAVQQLQDCRPLSATPTLRSDLADLEAVISKAQAGAVSFPVTHRVGNQLADDLDAYWGSAYRQLEHDVAVWSPSGSFAVRLSALYQVYQAFVAGGHEVEAAALVLEGQGGSDAKHELLQSSAEFSLSTSGFEGRLEPAAQQVWNRIEGGAPDRQFAGTIAQALTVVAGNEPAPFVADPAFAGASMRSGLDYLHDLGQLVVGESTGLAERATSLAGQAARSTAEVGTFLALLFACCLGAVGFAARYLTRPLVGLSRAAHRVREGELDAASLQVRGPREVRTATTAFNDMSDTLRVLEAQVVALAAEEIDSPSLRVPLPGRTGRALQATIDRLVTRIREREEHRRVLHQAATHDALTGLYNRAAVFDHLMTEVSRRRLEGEDVAVLFVDLDGLKVLNDDFGHDFGDHAIVATADALCDAVEDCDVVARLGGDEFLVVLCDRHSGAGQTAAGRIRERLASTSVTVGDVGVTLSASVGVALAQCGADTDPMELVHQADQAMYQAKRAARPERGAGGPVPVDGTMPSPSGANQRTVAGFNLDFLHK